MCGFCTQNNNFWFRITNPHGSQSSSVVFAFKTAAFGAELQVSMGPRPHLRFFTFKTATWATELQISMGAIPHLWFCVFKQRLLDQNYKSLWVPDLNYGFFAFKTATLSPELQVSMGAIPHLWFRECKTTWLASEILDSMVPALICGFCLQNSDFRTRITSLYRSQTSPTVFCI